MAIVWRRCKSSIPSCCTHVLLQREANLTILNLTVVREGRWAASPRCTRATFGI